MHATHDATHTHAHRRPPQCGPRVVVVVVVLHACSNFGTANLQRNLRSSLGNGVRSEPSIQRRQHARRQAIRMSASFLAAVDARSADSRPHPPPSPPSYVPAVGGTLRTVAGAVGTVACTVGTVASSAVGGALSGGASGAVSGATNGFRAGYSLAGVAGGAVGGAMGGAGGAVAGASSGAAMSSTLAAVGVAAGAVAGVASSAASSAAHAARDAACSAAAHLADKPPDEYRFGDVTRRALGALAARRTSDAGAAAAEAATPREPSKT